MGAFINLVKWEPDPNQQLFAWKYPHANLSTYTQLIVTESQEAILFSKGQLVGKFGPGKHTLNTENIPLLRSLFGIPFGGENPFTAEVWFVNKLLPLNLDWSTDAMMYHDPDYQTMVPLLAKGRYGVKINDPERFLIKLVGTTSSFTASQLYDNFYGATVAKTKSLLLQFITNQRIGIKSISAYLDGLSDSLRQAIAIFWEDYGFNLISFYITTIEVDSNTEAGQAIMKAMTQQSAQIIGGYTWQQAQVFDTTEKALDNLAGATGQGGLIGAIVATNMMGNVSGGLMNPTPYQNANPASPTPPSTPATRDVFCSNCAKKFANNNRFCPHCGDPYLACPRCGTDNDEKAKKCVSCGTGLIATGSSACGHCHSVLSPGAAFCADCGKPVPNMEGKCSRCSHTLRGANFCPQCGFKNA